MNAATPGHLIILLLITAIAAVTFASSTALAQQPLPPHMLELEAQISHEMVLINQPQEIFATIDIEALRADLDERPPMNLALVIDRSGSMRGDRIRQARQAAIHLVNSLGEQDRLALVTYGTDHTVEFDSMFATEENRRQMRNIISALNVDGWTNLSAGFEAGIEIVSEHHDDSAVNRVILLSDGHANRGITDPAQLQALSRQAFDNGISTSSIGFGLDYNARLMTGIAREGAGNYYFADDSHDLGALIAREMTGLTGTVANRIEAVITPGPGVEVVEVYGFNQRYRDGQLVIGLSELAAGQSRSIVLRLSAATQTADVLDVLDVRINYRDAVNDRHRYRRQVLRASVSDNAVEVENHIQLDVLARVEEVRLANTMDQAMQAYSSGNRQEAQSILERETTRSQQVRNQYGIESDRLDAMDSRARGMGQTVQRRAPSSAEGRRMQMDVSEEAFETQRRR